MVVFRKHITAACHASVRIDKENVVCLTQWRLVYIDCRRQKSSRQGAKPDLSGCIFDGVAVKSAFALLSTKVTKPVPYPALKDTDKKRCEVVFIGEND